MSSMLRSVACGLALSCGAMLALQGCGGGGPSGGSGGANTTVTTTTSPLPVGPSGLVWCEHVATYYKVTYGNDGVKTAAGQCLPSTSPGAYYTKPGQKGADGKSDKPWGCFSPDFAKDLWTNVKARAQGFEGACLIKDYSSSATPGSVDHCSKHLSHHPAVCSPGPTMFWGACWSKHSENWRCVPKGDATIPGLAKGDCKAAALLEPKSSVPTQYFYDGVCQFEQKALKLYKCDTVPGYAQGDAATCGQGVSYGDDKACFSLRSGVQWECLEANKPFNTPCDWTVQPNPYSNEFYKGACVFPSNQQYKNALDAHNLTVSVSHQMIV